LTLLTLNGLFWGVNSVSASATSLSGSNRNLSYTIAKLIDLDAHSLVELAIDRALIAQQVNDDRLQNPVTAGMPKLNNTQPNKQHTIRGRVAKPRDRPIGKIANPDLHQNSDLPQPTPSADNNQHPAGGIIKKNKD
jgi:hypothetical protein